MDIGISSLFSEPVLAIIFALIVYFAVKKCFEIYKDSNDKERIKRSFIITISIPIIIVLLVFLADNYKIRSIWGKVNSKKIGFLEERDSETKMDKLAEKYEGEQSGRKVNRLIDELIRMKEEDTDGKRMPGFKLYTTLDKREKGTVEGFEIPQDTLNYVDELKTMQYRVIEDHKYYVQFSYSNDYIYITFDASKKGYDLSELE